MYILAKILYYDDFYKIYFLLKTLEIKYNYISNELLKILEIAEDKRFLLHPGFDCVAILRSVLFFLLKKEISGASTIDQQLIRTLTNEKERTIKRKFKEIVLASAIGISFKKETIASIYINIAYYGWNMRGFRNAVKRLKHYNIVANDDLLYAIVSLLKYPLSKVPSKSSAAKIYNRINYIKNQERKSQQQLLVRDKYEIKSMV